MDYDDFDDYEDFLSDDSDVSIKNNDQMREPPEITQEQKLQNFFFYIIRGNLLGICELLDSGIEIGSILQDRWKPIVLAASIGNQEVIHELITRGANVNEHRDHMTVLMYVCNCLEKNSPFEKCYEIVLELLENGADVNMINCRKETALMFASGVGNVKIVEKLLTCCNISVEDQRGWNALFWAADSNRVEIVKILLNAGLEYNKRDACGKTPLSLAKMHEYSEMIDLLSNDTVRPSIVTMKNSYHLNDFLKGSGRPQFLPDIFTMLYGMRCENLQTLFLNTDLLSFLSSNHDSLLELGVILPYQRKRILMGLNKFHKHLFKKKSIPIVPKDSLYTTIDFSHALLTAVRHLTVMEANLVYILQSKDNVTNDVAESVIRIRHEFEMLKSAAKDLDALTQQWDNSNKSVDLITRQRPRLKWMKYTSFGIVLIGSVFLIKPIRFS